MKSISADDIYKSTQNLLRSLIVLTQGMDPLADTMMTMKLTYYDAVTPSDYEPAGFVPTPLVKPQLPVGSVHLQSGHVSTLHHSVQLGVRAVAGQRQQQQVQQVDDVNQQVEDVHQQVEEMFIRRWKMFIRMWKMGISNISSSAQVSQQRGQYSTKDNQMTS